MSRCVEMLDKLEPAQVFPVSVLEVLRHLRLDGVTEHTDEVTAILRRAVQYVEDESDLQLCSAKWRWTLDYFPCATLRLPLRPVLDASVRYRDTAGDWQTLDPTLYQLSGQASPPVLRLQPRGSWPTTYADSWDAVQIDLTVGHNGAELVPEQAKQAILLLCGHWFINREALSTGSMSKELEFSVSALLAQIAGREVV